jgi:glycosyltransferase involved in cell wall biosynthesis
MKKVLVLSYYFPPMGMGGTQRSAKFVKYLPHFGWEPVVITVKDIHYYAHDESLLQELAGRQIERTESWDPLRLLARFLKRRTAEHTQTDTGPISQRLHWLNRLISGWLLVPDSKILWLPFAICRSLALIWKQKIGVIYTTSPPHSAHLAGLCLKAMAGIRWIADFRDDWTGGESQPSPTWWHRFVNRWLEKWVLKSTDHTIAMCQHLADSLWRKSGHVAMKRKVTVLMNGYDRDDFRDALTLAPHERFTITHCGAITRVSDPEPLLRAVQKLLQDRPALKTEIVIQFIGTDLYGRLRDLTERLQLGETVLPLRYLPHRQAIQEIMRSHLLVLTIFKKTGEEIITGKIFEYLASGKPILMMAKPGEVARIIQTHGRGRVIDNEDIPGIQAAIFDYYQQFTAGCLPMAEPLSLQQFDREAQAGRLAAIFNQSTY